MCVCVWGWGDTAESSDSRPATRPACSITCSSSKGESAHESAFEDWRPLGSTAAASRDADRAREVCMHGQFSAGRLHDHSKATRRKKKVGVTPTIPEGVSR